MRYTTILLILFLMGCESLSSKHSNELNTDVENSHICEQPRPAICTREYMPVCAKLNGYEAPKTYATGCTACSDAQVHSYVSGPCEPRK